MWGQWLAFAILLIQRRTQYFHFGSTCDFLAGESQTLHMGVLTIFYEWNVAESVPWCN
jgi:hypothetical protein